MTSNKTSLLKSKTTWLIVAACAFVAAVPLGMHWLRPKRAEPIPNERPIANLDRLVQDQRLVSQRLQQHVLRERDAAERMRATDPRGALRRLESLCAS